MLLPVLLAGTGGCVATRNDLRILQADLGAYRAEAARADSAHRQALDSVLRVVRDADDSLRAANARLAKFQADMAQGMYQTNQQLLAIQELTGQSQRRLQELRADLEQRGQQMTSNVAAAPDSSRAAGAAPVAGVPTPSATPATVSSGAPAVPPGPGPNQLFQISLDQLRRGSNGAARAGFGQLLRQYPSSDVAGDAQFYLGEAWAAERRMANADSAYVLAFTRYPTAGRAATALYKHALYLQSEKKLADARTALQDVVTKYPRSDEAELARERLKTMK